MTVGFSVEDELYRELILDHYRNPRHHGTLPEATVTRQAVNPLCGDELTITLQLHHGQVKDIAFAGKGCSISQASASMMCDSVCGLSTGYAQEMVGRFRAMVLSDGSPDDLGDVEALQGVKRYPARIKCAVLPWNALSDAITDASRGNQRGST